MRDSVGYRLAHRNDVNVHVTIQVRLVSIRFGSAKHVIRQAALRANGQGCHYIRKLIADGDLMLHTSNEFVTCRVKVNATWADQACHFVNVSRCLIFNDFNRNM